jgi:hypothetical protein
MIRSVVSSLVRRLLFGPPPKTIRPPARGPRLHAERLAVDGAGIRAPRRLVRGGRR